MARFNRPCMCVLRAICCIPLSVRPRPCINIATPLFRSVRCALPPHFPMFSHSIRASCVNPVRDRIRRTVWMEEDLPRIGMIVYAYSFVLSSPELINIFANTALFLSHIATSDADGLDLASSSAGGYTPLRSFSRASIQTPAEQRPLVNFALSLYSADWFGSYCVHTAVFPFVGNMHIQWFSALRITLYPESTARF